MLIPSPDRMSRDRVKSRKGSGCILRKVSELGTEIKGTVKVGVHGSFFVF
jgi:hypothetical protein